MCLYRKFWRALPPAAMVFILTISFSTYCFLDIPNAHAQGSAQSGITSPSTGAAITGDVPIFGTAVIEPFQKYELNYKLEPSGDDAYIYFDGGTAPVVSGQLGIWHAGGLQPGTYSLRLRVVKNDGNYAEYFAKNLQVNLGPALPSATPTSNVPTETPIPTATFTPAPQPTPVLGQVTQPQLGNAASTSSAQTTPTSVAPQQEAAVITDTQAALANTNQATSLTAAKDQTQSSGGSGNLTRALGEALSLKRLRTHFLNGVRFSAALFAGVAALYAGKRLFDWVWNQFT